MSSAALIDAFKIQAQHCEDLGSPFTASLLRWLAVDIDQSGVTAWLMQDYDARPVGDAAALRLAGALHAAVLTERDPALAAQYPARRREWDMELILPLALDFLEREEPWVRGFLKNPPQTNETRRAIALAPALLGLSRFGPLHLLELGASAGLNLWWDRFAFRTRDWAWGRLTWESPLIDAEWNGPAPDLPMTVRIAARAGCDAQPLDVRDPDHRLRLSAYIWPDQRERLARLEKAMDLAAAQPPALEQADAGEWLSARLAPGLPQGVTAVYHSVAWQYFNPETRSLARTAIETAAAEATPDRRLAWLRFEHNKTLGFAEDGDGMSLDLTVWPGGERRRLAAVDPHGRSVTWLDPAVGAVTKQP